MKMDKQICIIGTGGSAREILCCLIDTLEYGVKVEDVACFMEKDEFYTVEEVMGVKVIKESEFNPEKYDVIIGLGDSKKRKIIAEKLPKETTYATLIHPTVICSEFVTIGEGTVISAGSILTCNITIGKHAQLNLQTTICHDAVIGDYFTTAPGVRLSGNCTIGNQVYFGTTASVRQGTTITDDVTIGMGGVVVKDITEPGVYVGNPVNKLR